MLVERTQHGMGMRSWRYSMYVRTASSEGFHRGQHPRQSARRWARNIRRRYDARVSQEPGGALKLGAHNLVVAAQRAGFRSSSLFKWAFLPVRVQMQFVFGVRVVVQRK
jgi:hypothetical protein